MATRELLAELEAVIAAGLPCVCCTVVATRGSTPQKAGATMLVFADGTQSGTLGGGCVEAEVRQRALQSLNADESKPAIHTFTLDDDYGWDDGLICGGRMTILADPIFLGARASGPLDSLPQVTSSPGSERSGPEARAPKTYFANLRELVEADAGCTEVIALPENRLGLPSGSRYLFDDAGRFVVSRHCENHEAIRNHLDHKKPTVSEGLAILPQAARIRLLIVGGGHVGQAVARLAAEVNFDCWVLDDRDSLVSVERFPHASRRIVGDIGRELKTLIPEITPNTFCLIVTRGHNHDEEALCHLAPTVAGYVGMIGSKRKVKLIFDDLRAKGISEEALARVDAPVGLNIGSESVAEIAVSIVAELIATRSGQLHHRHADDHQ